MQSPEAFGLGDWGHSGLALFPPAQSWDRAITDLPEQTGAAQG